MDAKTINLVRNNMGAYFLRQNAEFGYLSYQQDYIVPALHKLALHQLDALAILMPPRHGKSMLASINFLAWCFGRWPKLNNFLISYSDDYAREFGQKIMALINSDVHKQAFPESRISPLVRGAKHFALTAGGEFFSAGFGGQVTGRGVSGILCIDDPIKNMEEAKSEAIIRGRMEDYRSAAKLRLENGVRLMCLTRWCRNDFFDRVIAEDGTVDEGGEWTVLKVPAQAGANDPLFREPGEFLWPEKFGEKWKKTNQKNMSTWNAVCQQDPAANQGKRFKEAWLTYYQKRVMPGKFPTYILTDPSKGQDVKADFTVIGVWCATHEKKLLLVDAVMARLDPEETAQEHIRLIRKWKPVRWLYEEYGMVRDAWYLERALKKAAFNLKPITVGRRGPRHMVSKETRIEGISGMFREGIICLPDPKYVPFPTVNLGASVGDTEFDPEDEINIIDYFVNQEYLEYAGEGSTPHDDFLDMCTRLQEPELGIRYPTAPAELEAQMIERKNRYVGGTTWESAL